MTVDNANNADDEAGLTVSTAFPAGAAVTAATCERDDASVCDATISAGELATQSIALPAGEGITLTLTVAVDPDVTEIEAHDAIRVPSGTWHQFYASEDEPLGFLCMVESDRDRPEYPNAEQIEELCARIDTLPPPLKRAMVRS